jgi:hypothetical protein
MAAPPPGPPPEKNLAPTYETSVALFTYVPGYRVQTAPKRQNVFLVKFTAMKT